MSTPASAFGAAAIVKPAGNCSPADLLATLGVSAEEFGAHQEQMRRSFSSPQDTHLRYHNTSLPFPLNLPPSYPACLSTSASSAPTRHLRPTRLRHGASVMPDHISMTPGGVVDQSTRASSSLGASGSKGKGKQSLDAFMDSRQATQTQETDSSGSDSDTSLIKV